MFDFNANDAASHWRKAMSAFQSGVKHLRAKQYEQARDALETAVDEQQLAATQYEKSAIPMPIFNKHLTYGLMASKLGIAYRECGQWEKSEAALRGAIESYDKAGKLDATDQETLKESLSGLALLLHSRDRAEEAIPYENRCAELTQLQQKQITKPGFQSKIKVLILVPFFFFLATMSLGSCIHEWQPAVTTWSQGPASANWPVVSARIVTCDPYTNSSSGQIYQVDLDYEYMIDGKKYTSSRYGWNGWNDQASDSFAKGHKPGDVVQVRVSPAHPDMAVVDPTFQQAQASGGYLKCVILVSLALLFYAFCAWAVYGTFIAPKHAKGV